MSLTNIVLSNETLRSLLSPSTPFSLALLRITFDEASALESVVVDETLGETPFLSRDEAVSRLCSCLSSLPPQETRFVYIRMEDGLHALVFWSPEEVSVRDRMVYAGTWARVKEQLVPEFSLQCSSLDEMSSSDALFVGKGVNGSNDVTASMDLLSVDERARRDEMRASAREASSSSGFDFRSASSNVGGVSLPLTEAAAESLRSQCPIRPGVAVILSIHSTDEHVDILRSLPSFSSYENLVESFPDDSPSVSVVGLLNQVGSVFVYYCPEDSKPRDKMVASSCKGSIRAQLESLGCSFSFDIQATDSKSLVEDLSECGVVEKASSSSSSVSSLASAAAKVRPSNRGAPRLRGPAPPPPPMSSDY